MDVPGDVRRAIVKWAYQYLKDGAAPFPFVGNMGSDSYRFTIDFQRQNVLIFLSVKPCAWSSAVIHLSPVKSAKRFAVRRAAFSALASLNPTSEVVWKVTGGT